MKSFVGGVITLCCLAGCNGANSTTTKTTPAVSTPPPPKVTTATFEPVYRSAKTVQGATASGVSYMKFGELLQGFSTEIGIAKDHDLNEADKPLLALYQEALTHYQISAQFWSAKIHASGPLWKGEIPISFDKHPVPAMLKVAAGYELPVLDRTVGYGGGKYKAIPGDSVQRVWKYADRTLEKATALYYGKASTSP